MQEEDKQVYSILDYYDIKTVCVWVGVVRVETVLYFLGKIKWKIFIKKFVSKVLRIETMLSGRMLNI